MERTIFFSDWVNEYKPIEFNQVGPIEAYDYSTHLYAMGNIANSIGYNIIRKYLTFNYNDFPMNHINKVHIMNKCIRSRRPSGSLGAGHWAGHWTLDTGNSPRSELITTYSCSNFIVTRKPRMNSEDKIIIDFSKESSEYKFKIRLEEYYPSHWPLATGH